jgi:putative ABC transport system substrate-binding protein
VTTRRALLRSLATGALIAGTWPATAQPPPKIPRVGVLWFGSKNDLLFSRWSGVFRQSLSELGYIEGKTIVVDIRYAERNTERLNALAREFAASGVDIIVAPAVAASVAAKQATSTIPIVMLHAGNPVGAGLISSFARPGGNVTGTSNILLGGKQVQLLREVVPRLARLAILANPTNAGAPPALADAADAARSYNISLVVAEVSRVEDFPNAFAVIRNAHPDGLFIMSEPLIGGRIRAGDRVRGGHSASGNLRCRAGAPRRRADVVRTGFSRSLRDGRRIRGQDFEGRQTCGPSGSAGAQVRTGDQHEDGKGARTHNPTIAAAACE